MMNRLRNDAERLREENEGLKSQIQALGALASQSAPNVDLESLSREETPIKHVYRMADMPDEKGIVNTWFTNAREVLPVVARKLATTGTENQIAETLAVEINYKMYGNLAELVQVSIAAAQDFMLRLRRLALVEKSSNNLPGHWTLTTLGEKIAIEILKQQG
jgi:hypothetical protein